MARSLGGRRASAGTPIALLVALLALGAVLGPTGPGAPVAPRPPGPAPLISPSTSGVLSLSPTSGPVGSTISASGTGFADSSEITFTFDAVEVASNCRTDPTGTFPGTSGTACTFLAPEAPQGNETVVAAAVAPIASVSVGSHPFGVSYDPVEGEVFTGASQSYQVAVIRGTNDSVATNISFGTTEPWAVAYDAGHREVWVTSFYSDDVTVLNASSDALVATVGVGGSPYGIAYDPTVGELFVADSGSSNLSVINDTTRTVVASLSVGIGPYGVAYDSGHDRIDVSISGTDNLTVINAATNSIVAGVAVGSNPAGVAYDPTLGEVFVANYYSSNVSVINDTTDRVVGSVGVGLYPAGCTYDPSFAAVAVANAGSDNVSLIAAATDSVSTSIAVGTAPEVIAVDTAQGSLFVSNYLSANVTVIGVESPVGSTFTVNSSIALTPDAASIASSVAVTGTGFAANSTVALSLNGTSIAFSCSTDSMGSFPGRTGTACTFSVPAGASGLLNASATDGVNAATAFLRIIAGVQLNPAAAIVGTVVSATGTSFSADATIFFLVGGAPVATTCSTDANGSFPGTTGSSCTFRVPPHPGGITNVSASDGVHTAAANLTVERSVALSPSNGTLGSRVNAHGAGFASSSTIALSVGGVAVNTTCSSDANGSFPGTTGTACDFTVPAVPGGNDTVVASDATGVTRSISVGAEPFGVAVDYGTNEAYLSSSQTDSLSIVSDANGSLESAVSLSPTSPWAEAYDPRVGEVFVTSFYSDDVLVINDTTHRTVATIPVGGDPYGIVLDPQDGRLIVANSASNNVSVISDVTDTYLGGTPVGFGPYGVAFDPALGLVFVTESGGDAVTVLDPNAIAALVQIPVGGNPTGIAYDPLVGELFVANYYSDNVSVINSTTDTVVDSIGVGSEPAGVTYDPGQGDVFVADAGSDNVSVISPSTNRVVGSIPVGSAPEVIGADPSGESIFVSNYLSANVTMVSFPDRASANLSVNASLSVLAPSVAVDVGQVVTIGGAGFGNAARIGTFTVGGVAVNCTTATLGTCTSGNLSSDPLGSLIANFTVPTVPSSGPYRISLADGLGDAASATLTVDVDPSVSAPMASPTSVDVGQSVNFSVAASLGSGGYHYSWSGLPTGCASSDHATLACVAAGAGTYPVHVRVTDSNGFTVASGFLNFSVLPDPTASLPAASPSSGQVDAGQSVTFATIASLGSSVYIAYAWSGLPNGCVGHAANVTCSGDELPAGVVTISVRVTDSNGFTSAPGTGLTFVVTNDPLAGAPSPSAVSADVGQRFSISVAATSGSAPYSYGWAGLPDGCTGTLTDLVICTAADPAMLGVSVNVTDSNGFLVTSPTLAMSIFGDPTVALTADRLSLDARQPVVLTATATNGSGGFRYAWAGLPEDCGGSSATLRCVAPTPGRFTVTIVATDSNGISGTSAAVDLIVAPLPTANVSATPSAAGLGQTVLFQANVTGGTGPFNYTWSFGDGTFGTGPTERHAFLSAGNFSVTVWVNDSVGGSSSQIVSVLVAAPSTSPLSGWTGTDSIVALVAAVLLIAVAIVVLLRHRRASRGEPPGDADPSDVAPEDGALPYEPSGADGTLPETSGDEPQ